MRCARAGDCGTSYEMTKLPRHTKWYAIGIVVAACVVLELANRAVATALIVLALCIWSFAFGYFWREM